MENRDRSSNFVILQDKTKGTQNTRKMNKFVFAPWRPFFRIFSKIIFIFHFFYSIHGNYFYGTFMAVIRVSFQNVFIVFCSKI